MLLPPATSIPFQSDSIMNTCFQKCSLSTRMTRRPVRASRRSGISLFEVLISILVAAIGVLGVLVLVPFAARNAQLGIDRESAIDAAKNFNADFHAYGYHTPFTWFDDTAEVQVVTPVAPNVAQPLPGVVPNNIQAGWPYIIDPTGALRNFAISGAYDQFPTAGVLPGDFPRLNISNLYIPGTATPLGNELARQLSMQPDDLKFDDPATELGPPRQIYYAIGADNQAKRQYDGRYSTISFVIPDDDNYSKYRMYTVVGKAGDRSAERVFEVIDPAAASGTADTMRLVKTDIAPLANREFEQIGLGGGDLRLSELPTAGQPVLDKDQIRNNDWIMLISYHRIAAVEPTYDDIQIDFHRVIHADRVSPPGNSPPGTPGNGIVRGGPPAERTFNVTIQGSDFDLYRDWGARMVGERSQVPTYAILLPNVLAVYERTFRVEPDSTWQSN
jgi:hypothetical protein